MDCASAPNLPPQLPPCDQAKLHYNPCLMSNTTGARAVFLDRDGTIMEDASYVGTVDRVVLIPRAVEAMRRLQDAGFKLFVVTNQSGVGRGYFSREAVEQIHAHLDQHFHKAGVRLQRYYVCPHHPEDNCDCRKPKPKLLLQAAREFKLDLPRSYMIGDRPSDLQAGRNAGTKTILVLTGVGRETLASGEAAADHIAEDLWAAADWILAQPT
jgi:D-glycero-D-manno-heptose 1,7-bisphosphate phosphatase